MSDFILRYIFFNYFETSSGISIRYPKLNKQRCSLTRLNGIRSLSSCVGRVRLEA